MFKVESGNWKVEIGKWKLESGKWKFAAVHNRTAALLRAVIIHDMLL